MPTARVVRPLLFGALLLPFATALAQAPVAKVQPVTDDYYGTRVTDPYRWMESGKDPDWMPWLQAQAQHTHRVFAAMPGRASLLADVAARSGELTTVGQAEQAGGRVFHEIRAAGEQETRKRERGPAVAAIAGGVFSTPDEGRILVHPKHSLRPASDWPIPRSSRSMGPQAQAPAPLGRERGMITAYSPPRASVTTMQHNVAKMQRF